MQAARLGRTLDRRHVTGKHDMRLVKRRVSMALRERTATSGLERDGAARGRRHQVRGFGFALCVGLIALSAQAVRCQTVPAPWDQLATLTPDQRVAISKIDERANAQFTAQSAQIRARVNVADASFPERIEVDYGVQTKEALRITRLLEVRDIMQLLTDDQKQAADDAWKSFVRSSNIIKFAQFRAQQDNDLFCWAAAIQILLNYNGINIDQNEVAEEIRGNTDPATIHPQELEKITGWHGKGTDRSRAWAAECVYGFLANQIPPQVLVQMIDVNRQVLVSLEGQHVLIVHEVSYVGWPDRQQPQDVTVYDPMTGQDTPYKWADLEPRLTGWWYCYAQPSFSRTF